MKENVLEMEHIIGREQTMLSNKFDKLKGSYGAKKANLITHDEIIGHDYQGWPLYHLRVISFLRVLGVSEDIIKQIPEDILKTQISSIDDEKQSPNGELHGMRFGVNEAKCSNCSINPEKKIIYVWG